MCAVLATDGAVLQTNQPAPGGNKFLFIVDTSSAMKKVALPSRQAVFDMIYTGLYDQMKAGDSYGLWTFNQEPFTSIFPMQIWHPQQTMALASHAAKFLRDQPYRNRARLGPLMDKVLTIITGVKDVTVFIISDENTQVQGTPFDNQLKAAYTLNAEESAKATQPLITTLTARGGEIVSASVHIAGNPILLIQPAETIPNQYQEHPLASGKTNRQTVAVTKVQSTNSPASTSAQSRGNQASSKPREPFGGNRKAKAFGTKAGNSAMRSFADSGAKQVPSDTASKSVGNEVALPPTHTNNQRGSGSMKDIVDSNPAIPRDSTAETTSQAVVSSGSRKNNSNVEQRETSAATRPNPKLAPEVGAPAPYPATATSSEAADAIPKNAGDEVMEPSSANGVTVPSKFVAIETTSGILPVAARELAANRNTPIRDSLVLGDGGHPAHDSFKPGTLLLIGGALLLVFLALVLIGWQKARSQQPQESYITRSMNRMR